MTPSSAFAAAKTRFTNAPTSANAAELVRTAISECRAGRIDEPTYSAALESIAAAQRIAPSSEDANEPVGAILPDGTRIDQWDERLRAAGATPLYRDDLDGFDEADEDAA
jgi:hypothetical protein